MPQQSYQERPGRLKRLFSHQDSPLSSPKLAPDITEVKMAHLSSPPAMGNLVGPGQYTRAWGFRTYQLNMQIEKLAAVTELMSKLSKDLEAICLLPQRKS